MKICFFAFATITLATLLASFLAVGHAQAAVNTFKTGTSLSTADWSSGVVPTGGSEALIDSSYYTPTSGSLTFTANETFGDLIINASNVTNIYQTSNTQYTLTLTGTGGSSRRRRAGGAAGDLLLLGPNMTGTVIIGGGSGNKNLALAFAGSGNLNVLNPGATLAISAIISGAYNLAKTGSGTLTLSGAILSAVRAILSPYSPACWISTTPRHWAMPATPSSSTAERSTKRRLGRGYHQRLCPELE